jgi:hypothetical protein
MSTQEYDHSYGLVDDYTPTSTPRGTPLSSPSKARLLRPKFLNGGLPIKFKLPSHDTKDMYKEAEFVDTEYDDPFEKKRNNKIWSVAKVVSRLMRWLFFMLLLASAVYLYSLFGTPTLIQIRVVYSICGPLRATLEQRSQKLIQGRNDSQCPRRRIYHRLHRPSFASHSFNSVELRPGQRPPFAI